MTIPLDSGQIHVWCTFVRDVPDAALVDYRSLLTDDERARGERFYFARDRRRYLVTRALVRTVLSRYVPLDPRDWVFATNAYGKPHIANADAEAARLSFNLTHTDGLITLGVTRDCELGVDSENIRTREAPLDVAGAFFAPDEVTALSHLPRHRRHQRFFEYWTLKESYIKARGAGLAIPLDHFSFHFPSDRDVEIAIHPDQNDSSARWRFWQFWTGGEHLSAVCAERIAGAPPRIVARTFVPFGVPRDLECTPLRASASIAAVA